MRQRIDPVSQSLQHLLGILRSTKFECASKNLQGPTLQKKLHYSSVNVSGQWNTNNWEIFILNIGVGVVNLFPADNSCYVVPYFNWYWCISIFCNTKTYFSVLTSLPKLWVWLQNVSAVVWWSWNPADSHCWTLNCWASDLSTRPQISCWWHNFGTSW